MTLTELMSKSLNDVLADMEVANLKIFNNDESGGLQKIIVEYTPKEEHHGRAKAYMG